MSDQLQDWQIDIIQAWRNHSKRDIEDLDVTCLGVLLDTSNSAILEELHSPTRTAAAEDLATKTSQILGPDTTPLSSSECSSQGTSVDSVPKIDLPIFTPRNTNVTSPPQASCNISRNRQLPSDVAQSISTNGIKSGGLTLRGNSLDSTQQSLSIAVCSSPTPARLRRPTWGNLTSALPSSILSSIEHDIRSRKRKGCAASKKSGPQKGTFPCTLGCGRLSTSICDRRRHENEAYPGDYWVCYVCTQDRLSRPMIFHRLDKMQRHSKIKHPGDLNLNHCRVFNLRIAKPDRCGLCQYSFRSRHDWDDHTAKHHSGHARVNTRHSVSTKPTKVAAELRDRGNRIGNEGCQQSGFTSSNAVLTPAVDRITPSMLSTSTSLASSNDPKLPLADLHNVFETYQPGQQLPSHESRNLSIIRLCSLSAIGSVAEPQSDVCLLVVNWIDKISDKGATATIFKVEIAFDMVLHRSSEPMLYAVKQFSHADCQLFMQEAGAYNAVAHSGSNAITKCFGTFRDRDAAGHVTHNLLLERGQSDLWGYWMCTSPPRAFRDISTSYSRFFDLFKAVDTLHQMRQPSKGGLLHGRHGDLKPENILFFSDKKEHTRFKIGDFGLAHMRLQQQSRPGEEADSCSVMWGGGTRRYCAPEYDNTKSGRVTSVRRSRNHDIWALGCIMLEFVVWTLCGADGVRAFRNDRRISSKTSFDNLTAAFHDGQKLSPTVSSWLSNLRNSVRPHDKISKPVLDVVDTILTHQGPVDRLTTAELYQSLTKILQRAEQEAPPTPLRFDGYTEYDPQLNPLSSLDFNPNFEYKPFVPQDTIGTSQSFSDTFSDSGILKCTSDPFNDSAIFTYSSDLSDAQWRDTYDWDTSPSVLATEEPFSAWPDTCNSFEDPEMFLNLSGTSDSQWTGVWADDSVFLS